MDRIKFALISGTEDLINSKSTVSDFLFKEREKLDDQYSLDQVLQAEASASGFSDDLENLEDEEDEISKANKLLNWNPKRNLEDYIK